jgi:hypothetical protein
MSNFRHELEWYGYYYIPSRDKIAICDNNSHCKIFYYDKQEVLRRISFHKFNPFLLPIFQEALKHFPKEEETNVIKSIQDNT